MTVRLAVVVVCAAFDSRRVALMHRQRLALGKPPAGVTVEVHNDYTRKGPWHANRIGWLQSLSHRPTHCMTLAEDLIPCADFLETAQHLCEQWPDRTLSFMCMRPEIRTALDAGKHWMTSPDAGCGGSIIFPVDVLREFLAWNKRYVSDRLVIDDSRNHLFLQATGRTMWHTAPSLLEHGGSGMSTDFMDSPQARLATAFIGTAGRGMAIDWSAGADDPVVGRVGSWQYRQVSNVMTQADAQAAGLGHYWRPHFVGHLSHKGIVRDQ